MFTGIVEETGTVHAIRRATESIRLEVAARIAGKGVALGDSVAVNGCCLTVVARRSVRGRALLSFDLLQETWDRTNLSSLVPGARVNLERSLAVGARLGGHFVTGHVDDTGTITRWERRGSDHVLEVAAPKSVRPFLLFKGSIAVDGISLTVAAVTRSGFRVWIIPHTREVTALSERSVGDRVNLEADLLGKYVAHLMPRAGRRSVRRRG
ncbi:MAG: riboflavin synthase [Verrucomicrobiales bacterium]|nr:riboflavin synthase [Verrucomicrobiales bacterium]